MGTEMKIRAAMCSLVTVKLDDGHAGFIVLVSLFLDMF